MKKLCSLLIVLAILVAGLGFYRGWFTLSSGRHVESNKVDVNLTVDRDKVNEDAEKLKDKTTELTGK
jgi:hypothetical protein